LDSLAGRGPIDRARRRRADDQFRKKRPPNPRRTNK
jgi:hypothetical protein